MRPVAEPEYEFELPDTADEAWRFTATVEIQSLPEIVDWTTLEVARAEVEVPQDQDFELEALRESVAELAPADGRPARDGDTLVVDLVDSNGEAQRDTVVELGAGRMAASRDGSARRLGRGHGEVSLADGTTSTVEITVREVQEKVLPPLDDDLARAASEFDTLGDLRASIEGTLREQLDAEVDAAFVAAVDELVRASQVQPALPLIAAEPPISHRLRPLARAPRCLARRRTSRRAGSAEELQRQMVLEAAVSISRELALEALAERAGSTSRTTR